ncbi:MAG TPA: enoyl-CoA hydratase-related protein [Pirellulaceae bacterium]|nr:enoyl-CoA hydratase-related protein [Pirellulaceae bacterium]
MITSTTENGIGRITLNRPDKRNALTHELIEQLQEAVQEQGSDPQLRLLIFQATGKVFCAGMDLGEMQQRACSPHAEQEWMEDSKVYCNLLTKIFTLPVPTVAAIQGPVLAGGMGFVLACDFMGSVESAFFALPEPLRGITAAIVTPLLIHRVGAGTASHWLLSGEQVSPQRAMQVGLVHDVVPDELLERRIDMLAKSILTGSPRALAITKQHVLDCSPSPVVSQLRDSVQVSAVARGTDDAREGLAAFLEKRKPHWQR